MGPTHIGIIEETSLVIVEHLLDGIITFPVCSNKMMFTGIGANTVCLTDCSRHCFYESPLAFLKAF